MQNSKISMDVKSILSLQERFALEIGDLHGK